MRELERADTEYEQSLDIPPSPFVWLMDSECCERCGCILDDFESVLCTDCLHDAWYNEEQAFYDSWFNFDEDEPEQEAGA